MHAGYRLAFYALAAQLAARPYFTLACAAIALRAHPELRAHYRAMELYIAAVQAANT